MVEPGRKAKKKQNDGFEKCTMNANRTCIRCVCIKIVYQWEWGCVCFVPSAHQISLIYVIHLDICNDFSFRHAHTCPTDKSIDF